MARTIGFTALNAQDDAVLAPEIDVQWTERYLGRPVLRYAAEADDNLAADRVGVVLRGTELLQLKSDGLLVQFQARDATTLAVTLAWATIATPSVAGRPVALMHNGSTTLAVWTDSLTTVRYRTSTDGGRTWTAAATLHTAAAGNTVYSLLQSAEGAIAVEERFAGSTARLHTYSWGGAFTLINTFDTGATQIAGGSVDANSSRVFFAGDFVEATVGGTVTIRYVKAYAIGGGILGTLHQGVAGGARWRDPLYIRSATLQHYVLAVLQLPRGSGDLSDRVNVYPWSPSAVDTLYPLGPPRAVYAVEDSEGIAVAKSTAGLYIMAGSHVTLVVEASATGSLAVDALAIDHDPEAEQLAIETPGWAGTGHQRVGDAAPGAAWVRGRLRGHGPVLARLARGQRPRGRRAGGVWSLGRAAARAAADELRADRSRG